MKKLILLSVMCCAILFANAQTNTKTTTTNDKTTAIDQNKSKTPVQTKDLLKAITDNITKDYPGYKIMESYKITEKDVITYEVIVEKGTTKVKLIYDKDGKFLHKGNAIPIKATQTNKTSTNHSDTLKK